MTTHPPESNNDKLLAQAPVPEQLIASHQRKLEALLQNTTVVNNKLLAGIAAILCIFVGLAFVYASTQISHDRIPYLLIGLLLIIISLIILAWQIVGSRYEKHLSAFQYTVKASTNLLWAIAAISCILVGWGLVIVSTELLSGHVRYMSAAAASLTLAFIFVWQIFSSPRKMNMLLIWTALLVGIVSTMAVYGLANIAAIKHTWAFSAMLLGTAIFLYGIVPLIFLTIHKFAERVIEEIKELKIEIVDLREKMQMGRIDP